MKVLSLRWLLASIVGAALVLGYCRSALAIDASNLTVGEEMTVAGVKEFAIENPQILSGGTSRDGHGVTLRGIKPGNSKVILKMPEGNKTLDVTVSARDPNQLKQEIDVLLRNYPDIQQRVSNSQVIIEGSVKTEAELQQIREIAKRYAGLVNLLVTIGPSGVRRNVMVRLDLHYVQVRRRLLRKFGLSYPPTINGGDIANFFLNSAGAPMTGGVTQYSLISNLMPNLDFNEANGFIKVMRTDTLITENGSRAVYRDGTEIRIRLSSALGTGSLQDVFFGSSLTITPRLTASNDAVTLEIVADLSQLDSAAQQDGIPGRLVDSIQTTVHVPIGQSVMLAGVDSRAIGRSTSGIPWLSRIPILGYLFGSEAKNAESIYGVIYITPTLVEQSGPQLQQFVDRALKYFEDPARCRAKKEDLMATFSADLLDVRGGKAALLVLFAVLLLATITDLQRRRIPNLLTGPAAILAIGLHLSLDGMWGGLSAVTAYAVWFLGGFAFYRFIGGIGAGDIKLLMACAALIGMLPALYVAFVSFLLQSLWLFARWVTMGTAVVNFRRLGQWLYTLVVPGIPASHFQPVGTPDRSPHGPFILVAAVGVTVLWWSRYVQF